MWEKRSFAMKFRHLVVLLGCVLGGLTFSLSTPVYAQSLVLNPAAQSPHWPHIKVFDYARSLFLASLSPAEYQWYVNHLDAVEVHGNGSAVRAINPTSGMFSYQFDMSAFTTTDFSGLPESGFLHFSEDTSLTFWNLAKTQIVGTASITGCSGTPTPACRLQTYLWTDNRYVFNPQSDAFRTWQSAKILGPLNVYGKSNDTSTMIWIDEHAPGLSWPLTFGYQTIINTGGAIKEFGGRRPWKAGVSNQSLEIDYGQALADWLKLLKTDADAAGKKIAINSGPELFNSGYNTTLKAQVDAVRGFATENTHKPDGFANATVYQQWVTHVNTTTAAGGIVDLSTTWCTSGPSGYTPGNYSSVPARFRMWRLASYYQFKEPVGSPGIVYFNPGFCSNNSASTNTAAADQANWALAYQVDVGLPSGPMTTYQTGTSGGCTYTIFGRQYTKALVLVRPKDGASCANYSDTSAVLVTFSSPVQLLREDGTVTAFVTTTSMRNADSIIAMQVTGAVDTQKPSAPAGLTIR